VELGHIRDQVLVTHMSCFINVNDKWAIELTGRGSRRTKATERLENTERTVRGLYGKKASKFSSRRHCRVWDCI